MDRIADSMTLEVFLYSEGVKRPSSSSILENILWEKL